MLVFVGWDVLLVCWCLLDGMSYLCAGACWMGCLVCVLVFVGWDVLLVCWCLLDGMSFLCAGACWMGCHTCVLVFVGWDVMLVCMCLLDVHQEAPLSFSCHVMLFR